MLGESCGNLASYYTSQRNSAESANASVVWQPGSCFRYYACYAI